jgi:ATP-binding cassette subfamily B protein
MHSAGNGWRSFVQYDESKPQPQVNRQLLRRVLGYALPHWKELALMLLAICFTTLSGLIPPLLYRDLIDNVLPNRDFTQLNWLALGMIGIPLISGLVGVAQRYLSAMVGEGIICDLRQTMYDHLQRMSLRFFTHTKSGEMISRFNNDVVGAQNALASTLPDVASNGITLVSTLVVMVSIDWRLALLSVLVLPLFLLPTRRVGRSLRRIRRESLEYNAQMNNIVAETLGINGMLLTKTFGRQSQETARFNKASYDVRSIGLRQALVGRWFFLGLSISSAIGTALIYWIGGYLVLNEAITIGTIVAFAAYLARLYGPLAALSTVQVSLAQSLVSFERVFEYLDLPIEIGDTTGAIRLQNVKGHLRFENVWFSYQTEDELTESTGNESLKSEEKPEEATTSSDKPRWALSELSFEIRPGQLTALVGLSGAGKTTLTYLLPRLYDPTLGRITLDGHDLRDVTLESLAHQIGMVTQETYLFHDTVRANLLYARPDASQSQLEGACKAANIHDLIADMPHGYDTVVGERGYRLSGGEKQRLAIARVILKDPRLLVLDEATSHLDSHSEALIQSALEPLLVGRTSLVIAHRLSTIMAADQILVLESGRLVDQGTHAELLERGGLYAHLYETQFRSQRGHSTDIQPQS